MFLPPSQLWVLDPVRSLFVGGRWHCFGASPAASSIGGRCRSVCLGCAQAPADGGASLGSCWSPAQRELLPEGGRKGTVKHDVCSHFLCVIANLTGRICHHMSRSVPGSGSAPVLGARQRIALLEDPGYAKLVCQPVHPHGLIIINIKIKSIIIIIHLTSFSSIKYSNTYSNIYIFII